MISIIEEIFSYPFMVRAIIVGVLIALCAALLGVSLVLKRYSMIGDGLSHVGFGALAVATAMNVTPLKVAIPVVVVAAFLLLRISSNGKIKGDAAIALISTSALAIGVTVISFSSGSSIDVCNYMFGSILAMNTADLKFSIILSVIVIIMFVFFYNKIFAVTFDENFAKATGTKAELYNMLIAFLTAITIVLGMRLMGALLISSLIIFPALTSMRVCKTFKSVIIVSTILSVICFFAGMVISYEYSTPAGASVVIVNVLAFIIFWILGTIKNKVNIRKVSTVAGIIIVAGTLFSACGNKDENSNDSGNKDTSIASTENSTKGENPTKSDEEITSPQTEMEDTDDVPEVDRDYKEYGEITIVDDKVFYPMISDMYTNYKDYDGKTIAIVGKFYGEEHNGEMYYCVYRYDTTGCCVYALEVKWDEEYPDINKWVEVVGTFKYYTDEEGTWPVIDVKEMNIIE